MKSGQATPGPRKTIGWPLLVLVLPALILFTAVVIVPVLHLLMESFVAADPVTGASKGVTVGNYVRFFSDPFYLVVLLRTVWISLLTSLICLVIGWPIALQLTRTAGRARVYLTLIILTPLLISAVVRTFGWAIILGQSGPLNVMLQALGILGGPIRLMFTEAAVIMGLVHMLLPLSILPIAAALDSIDPSLTRAATNLGATPAKVFTRVLLPLSVPGILAGTAITFGLTASALVTPSLLGGARFKLMSSLIYQSNIITIDVPFGAALSIILLFVTVGIVTVYTRVATKTLFKGVFQR